MIVNELSGKGITSARPSLALRGLGYRLQANSKTREGGQHIDRDAQSQYINEQAKALLAGHEPIVSVDLEN
jgi:hypothetical protein